MEWITKIKLNFKNKGELIIGEWFWDQHNGKLGAEYRQRYNDEYDLLRVKMDNKVCDWEDIRDLLNKLDVDNIDWNMSYCEYWWQRNLIEALDVDSKAYEIITEVNTNGDIFSSKGSNYFDDEKLYLEEDDFVEEWY